MTMTPYDRTPTDDTPTMHAWDPTGPAVGDGAWRAVTDPTEMAYLDAALAVGAVGDVYVADDPTYEVWIAPEGVAAPAPDGWTCDDGYMLDPAYETVDLHLHPAPDDGMMRPDADDTVWRSASDVGAPDRARDHGAPAPFDIDAAVCDVM